MEPEVLASIIAAATALIAVVVGPIITFRASKNQMLGPMRQAWINDLRDTVAEFTAHTCIARWHVLASINDPSDVQRAQEIEDRTRFQLAYQLKEKIALLINPKETDHQELVRLVENAYTAYVNGTDTTIALKAIREHTQVILKREWDVVKK